MKEKDLHLISSLILISFLFLFNLINLGLYLSNVGEVSLTKEISDISFITNTLSFSLKIFFVSFFLIASFIFIFLFRKSPKKEEYFYLINALTLALNFDVFLSSLFFLVDKIHNFNELPTTIIISLVLIGLSFTLVLISFVSKVKKKVSLFLVFTSIILVLFSYSLLVLKELEGSKINYIFAIKIVFLILAILVYSFYIVSYLSYDPVYEISIKHNEKYIDKHKHIEDALVELDKEFEEGKISESKYLEVKSNLEKRI